MPKWRTPKGTQLRHCAKVALAAVVAYALTFGGRNDYALFSAMGASLVVGGSVGEDLKTSLNRVRGTVAGALVGAAFAIVLGKTIWSLGIAVGVMAWLSIGLGWGVAAMRVGIPMTLVILFTHEADATHYSVWRVLNTLMGVIIGIAISRFVWPIRAHDEVAAAIDSALTATTAALDALASGATSDALRPLQVQLLGTLGEIRTARTNARLARQLDRNADLLTERTVLAVRAAIDTLGASLKLDELVQAGARTECLQAVRHAIEPLAAHARDATSNDALADDFPARHEAAVREATHPEVDTGARALLAGLLSELQQIRAALVAMRASESRAAIR